MRNRLFVILFSGFLLALLIFAPVKRALVGAGIMSYENVGNVIETDEGGAAGLIAFAEDTYTNYAPLYNAAVRLHDRMAAAVDEPVTGYLMTLAARERTGGPDADAVPAAGAPPAEESGAADGAAAPAGDAAPEEEKTPRVLSHTARFINATNTHRNYYITMEFADGTTGSFLDRVVALPEEELQSRLAVTIENLQRICSYKTDRVHYYLYSGSRFQDMPYLSDYIPTEESSWDDLSRLFDALPDNVRYDYLKFEDGYDRLRYIYRTDHHWTAAGCDAGYRDILAMMRLDTPDIGEPLEGTEYALTDIRFNGSFSRFTNFYEIWDALSFTDYGLPACTTEGSGTRIGDAMKFYLSDRAAHVRTITYEEFYPSFTKVTYPDNETGRNLLIIGDSFARCLAETLAYHFDTTYIVYAGGGVDLNRCINRFGVTDVLILMYSDRLLYTVYNEVRWDAILTRGSGN